MSIITIKVLRTISKIVLLIVGIGIIGYGGLMVYKSVTNKPQRVRITNVTDSAATITWVTDNPVRGVVYYKDEGSFLPGPLGFLGSKVAYDDRDFARAQDECVTAFNENAKNTKDEDFAVDGNNFDCENIPVEKLGAYYTHSVTIKDLDDSSTYFFVVGNGIWSWKASSDSITTFENLESIETPLPIFGRVSGDDDSFSNDALVYVTFTSLGNEQENKVTESILYSSTTNEDGGWYVDASSIRDSDGNVLPLELGNDLFEIQAIYSNYGESEGEGHVFGYFETTVFDIIVEKSSDIKSATNRFIFNSYADEHAECIAKYDPDWLCDGDTVKQIEDGTADCNKIGPGNCLKILSGGDKVLDATEKANIKDSGKNYGFLVNDLDYVANIQKICNCDDGEVCKNGECVVEVSLNPDPVGGGVVLKPCIDDSGKRIPAGSRCPSGGTCDGRTGDCSGVERGRTSKYCLDDDGKSILVGKRCPVLGGTCDGTTLKCSGVVTPTGTQCTHVGDCINNVRAAGSKRCVSKGRGFSPEWKNYEEACSSDGGSGEKEVVKTSPPKPELFDVNCEPGGGTNTCKVSSRNGLAQTYLDINAPIIRQIFRTGESIAFASATISGIAIDTYNFDKSTVENISSVIKRDATLKEALIAEMELFSRTNDNIRLKATCTLINYEYSEDENGKGECSASSESSATFFPSSSVFAEDDSYAIYLPEYGLYDFQLGDYVLNKDVLDSGDYVVFYVETNGLEGLQIPEDPANPKETEDHLIQASGFNITYEKVSSAQSYTLVKGINLVSFNFIPVSTELGPLTAKGVIEEAAKKGVIIQDISSFDGGRWAKGYTCNGEECSGNDFVILPGKGYLVYATKGGEMTIPGYNLKSSVPVNLSGGWNLVGIHGYTTAYTARTLIDSMSKIDGVTANNVTWWPTSKGMYEGLQVTGEQEYGFDFPISPTNGYFVRISSFKPEDSKCKSLLWNEGGTLNGACGITK